MISDAQNWDELQRLFDLAGHTTSETRETILREACPDDDLRRRVLALLNSSDLSVPTAVGNGLRIGPYTVVELIGSGGFGSVYLAERQLGGATQTVALKILAPHAAGRRFVERFEREQQILAALEHPKVTRLIDAGLSDTGQPYLVTEFVEGRHLDVYCNENSLNADQRLALFDQVCSAVDYAHRNLIIHLDLKPSNILVTPDGDVKLLDFGTAKLVEPDGSHTATVIATPSYGSPEQLSGGVLTTASDTYSLGVVLFELLAGERPAREKPLAPSTWPADLATLVLHCLAALPEERYKSVSALAEDVARYRQGLPILAHPQTALYKFTKFIKRNRGKAAAAMLLIAALAGSISYAWVAQARSLRNAQRAVRMQTFLYRSFKNANPNVVGKPQPTVTEFLERSAQVLPLYIRDSADLRYAQLSLALSLFWNQDLAPARKLYEAALGSAQSSGDQTAEAEALGGLAHIAFFEGRNMEARDQINRSFALAAKADVPGDLRLLIAQNYVLINSDLGADAVRLKTALAKAIQEARSKGVNASDIAESLNYLAALELNTGNVNAAEKDYQDALAFYRTDPESECDQSLTQLGLGGVLREQNRPRQAVDLFRQSYSTQVKCWGPTPYTQNLEARLADAMVASGDVAGGLGMLEKARERWNQPPVNASLAYTNLRYLAKGLVDAGRFSEADQVLNQAFELFGKTLPTGDKRLAGENLLWAQALAGMGRYSDALPHAQASERVLSRNPITPLQKSTSEVAQATLRTIRSKITAH